MSNWPCPRAKSRPHGISMLGVLGLAEMPKPEALARRGGCWFEQGSVKIHLGVMPDFRPATKAHPAFVVRDLRAMRARCAAAGIDCTDDEPLAGFVRTFCGRPVRQPHRVDAAIAAVGDWGSESSPRPTQPHPPHSEKPIWRWPRSGARE